jgi:hypothetical protein
MTKLYALLLAVYTANGYAAVDEHRLQACLSLEVAQVFQTTPPPASAEEGFRAGYVKGFDFISPYEAFIKSMPRYAERFPKTLNASIEAGERMGRYLARETVGREVARCRQEFLNEQAARPGAEVTREQSVAAVRERCNVRDPDIADSFAGDCVNGYASGYGVAKGRDVYVGYFKDGLPHGLGRYWWGPSSQWPTEEYDGWYHKGRAAGFGIKSIARSGAHPATEVFKLLGAVREGRLEVVGRYSGNSLEFHTPCATERECLESIPDVQFDAVRTLGARPQAHIPTEEVTRATRTVIDRELRLQTHVSQCIATELVEELLQAASPTVTRAMIAEYARTASDKSLLSRLIGFCLTSSRQ